MRYEFHPEALEEYDEAGHYYASRQPGLDLQFILAVEEAIELVTENPLRWPVFDEPIRRCLTRVFPYAVLYSIEEGDGESDYVLIIAVAHSSREPGYWKHRLT
jgi:plasmid stabilization system protein ParE